MWGPCPQLAQQKSDGGVPKHPPLCVGGGVENVRVHFQPSKHGQRTILTAKKKECTLPTEIFK